MSMASGVASELVKGHQTVLKIRPSDSGDVAMLQ